MTMKISGHAASAREAARKADGKFGAQQHDRSSVHLSFDDREAKIDAVAEALEMRARYDGPQRRDIENLSTEALDFAEAGVARGLGEDAVRHAEDLVALGYTAQDADVISPGPSTNRIAPTVARIVERQLSPAHARVITVRIGPILDASLKVVPGWASESVLSARDPERLADALERQDRTEAVQHRFLALAADPSREDRFDEADDHGISLPLTIESEASLADVAGVRDATGVHERTALFAVRRGFDSESASVYGPPVISNHLAIDARQIRELENSGAARVDIRAAITAFPKALQSEVGAMAMARPGTSAADIRRYSTLIEDGPVDYTELARTMWKVELPPEEDEDGEDW